jgi:hypothetical protein
MMTRDELKVLADLVSHCCTTGTTLTGKVLIDSSAIPERTDAMRLLITYGLMELASDKGRRVLAEWTPAGKEIMALRVTPPHSN